MLDVEGAMLAERFHKLLCQEQQAERAYAELADKTGDTSARRQLEQIHREKARHVQLVERLLEIVE